ncbi:hypothetical protein CONLIGDRAFT_130716 [Coniochaeta ligniaria NRRL 30616]|uniref:Secreted protein n=1 Tax=Coniochaeta ligniaria NRRL 30616 TaxID=1408157 RepID=A0A1J7I7M5_9PEZI|nr:hypothetical protein CONLIGDRAFT_130716 [Coniochaeta ligniaria NRRL 30616]
MRPHFAGGGFIFFFCWFVHDKPSVILRVSIRWPETVSAGPGCWSPYWHMTGPSCEVSQGHWLLASLLFSPWRIVTSIYDVFSLYWVNQIGVARRGYPSSVLELFWQAVRPSASSACDCCDIGPKTPCRSHGDSRWLPSRSAGSDGHFFGRQCLFVCLRWKQSATARPTQLQQFVCLVKGLFAEYDLQTVLGILGIKHSATNRPFHRAYELAR